jgi:anti-sigma-K factor RskA
MEGGQAMNNQQTEHCLQCSAYLLSQLTEEERLQFEDHLSDCENCQRELAELQPVAHLLPFTADPVPLPTELKERTLQAAFAAKPPVQKRLGDQHPQPAVNREAAWHIFVSNRYGKLAAGLVAALTIALAASLFQLNQYKNRLESAPNDRPAPTTKVERSFPLYTTNPNAQMSGVAYLTETKEGVQLVVQVHNAPSLTGEQAYQVWLLKNGQRINAGTFRVNENGTGILVFTSGTAPNFDNIGITLEPDANGTQPRGPKVLGTKI